MLRKLDYAHDFVGEIDPFILLLDSIKLVIESFQIESVFGT